MNLNEKRLFMTFGGTLLIALGVLYFVDSPEDKDLIESQKIQKPFKEILDTSISTIKISYPDTEPVQITKMAGKWEIISPIEARADAKRINRIISTVLNVSCGKSLPNEPASYGLEPPKWQIQMGDGERELIHLKVGLDSPVGRQSYLLCPAAELVQLSASKLSTSLKGGIAGLRDHSLFSFESMELDRIVFNDGVELQKRQMRWRIVSPYRAEVSSSAINSWLTKTVNSRGESFTQKQPSDTTSHKTLILASQEREESVSIFGRYLLSSLHQTHLTPSEDTLALVSANGTDFLSRDINLDNDDADHIQLKLLGIEIKADKMDGAWTDNGQLFQAVKEKTIRQRESPPLIDRSKTSQGELIVGYESDAIKTYSLYGPDTNDRWWMTHSDEDIYIQAPRSLIELVQPTERDGSNDSLGTGQ